MEIAEVVLGSLTGLLWGNWMLFALLGLGVFCTVVAGRIQFRSIPQIMRELCSKEERTEGTQDHKGTVSSIQALYMTIASYAGSGNIVGVATALIGGGSGVLLQMRAAAFLGMATKHAEIVSRLVFRQKGADGSYYKGPVYYTERGFHIGLLDVAAAVLLLFRSVGKTLIQSNTILDVASQVFGVPEAVTGTLMAAVMVLIIGGGLKRLTDMAQKVVSVMAPLYTVGGIVVVSTNLGLILPMFGGILQDICFMKVEMGIAAGLTMKETMRFGVARGLHSNEAGEGSAVVIHSAAQAGHSAGQGFYGAVEMFVDTMVTCNTTDFFILASGVSLEGAGTTSLAAETFGTVAPLFKYVVPVSLILFAPTSIISQWYSGHMDPMHIESLKGDHFYRILFPVLTLLGSLSTIGIVWFAQDCMLGFLIIPNVLVLLKFSPVVMRMTREFLRENQQGAKKL